MEGSCQAAAWPASPLESIAQVLNWATSKLCLDPQLSASSALWYRLWCEDSAGERKPISEVEVNTKDYNLYGVK